VPRWDNAPQDHSRVSNIKVDIYKYPMKNISRTAKFLPTFHNFFSNIKIDIWYPAVGLRCIIPSRHLNLKGIARVFNWLKCLGGIMHFKPTAGYQISIFIFENKLWRGSYIFHGIFININVDIWHPAVGLTCIIPPRDLSQLKTRAWKIYQGRRSSSPPLAKLKVLPGSLTDLSA
jgi:hypothetical protein